ncbi:MAG: hypothetical protein H6962_10205 [Chromatiaceae bacterium]|nr:hypothetical protein [Chromatiaceae bacterium]
MSRVREAPDHNGLAFGADMIGRSSKQRAIRAIELISGALEGRGIHLQRVHPVQRGRRVDAYYLQFSDNAYEYLKQFTVLESGHWPSSQARGTDADVAPLPGPLQRRLAVHRYQHRRTAALGGPMVQVAAHAACGAVVHWNSSTRRRLATAVRPCASSTGSKS